MKEIFNETLDKYLNEKNLHPLRDNYLAKKIRSDYPNEIEKMIDDKSFMVKGSTGQGRWADCPWIAILNLLITDTPEDGYYLVFLFKSDMSGVYLSLNQGTTQVKLKAKKNKSNAKEILQKRAKYFRSKLNLNYNILKTEIHLNSKLSLAKSYEHGNIVAKYYDKNYLFTDDQLKSDINEFLQYYKQLISLDTCLIYSQSIIDFENKKIRKHLIVERNSSLTKKVKKRKGYKCEVCGFDFYEKYGNIGKNFIEAHHLIPISTLDVGKYQVDLDKDFAVLCSNCHSMIHKLEDPSDIKILKEIIKSKDK